MHAADLQNGGALAETVAYCAWQKSSAVLRCYVMGPFQLKDAATRHGLTRFSAHADGSLRARGLNSHASGNSPANDDAEPMAELLLPEADHNICRPAITGRSTQRKGGSPSNT